MMQPISPVRIESAQRLLSRNATPAALVMVGVATACLIDYCSSLHRFGQGILVFLAVFITQFALYLIACRATLQSNPTGSHHSRASSAVKLAVVLLFAAFFRGQLVDEIPYLSSDVYRYIWDGKVQAAGINPFRHLPVDPALAHLRDHDIYENINRRDFAHTIYPPAAQAIFLTTYLTSGSNVTAFKIGMSLFDGLAILAIMLALRRFRHDPSRVVVFAWHPLIIWEGAHSGHIESAALAFLALALLAWSYQRYALTGVAIALSALTKLYPILLLPAFLAAVDPSRKLGGRFALSSLFTRQNFLLLGAFAATVVIAYAPYLGVGAGVFGYLPGYLQEEGFVGAGHRYFLLALIQGIFPLPSSVYSLMAGAAILALAIWAVTRVKRTADEVSRAAVALIGLFLLLSSPRYCWYFAWIVPFLCFAPAVAWLYLSGASVLLYMLWLTSDYPEVPIWLGAAVYVPTIGMLVWEWISRRSAPGEAGASPPSQRES